MRGESCRTEAECSAKASGRMGPKLCVCARVRVSWVCVCGVCVHVVHVCMLHVHMCVLCACTCVLCTCVVCVLCVGVCYVSVHACACVCAVCTCCVCVCACTCGCYVCGLCTCVVCVHVCVWLVAMDTAGSPPDLSPPLFAGKGVRLGSHGLSQTTFPRSPGSWLSR